MSETLPNPSPQQQDIFAAISRGDHNICVDAKAGSGKTTTIIEGMKYVPSTGYVKPSMLFLAFNKGIADTLEQRCPRHVVCGTFHRIGRRAGVDSGLFE